MHPQFFHNTALIEGCAASPEGLATPPIEAIGITQGEQLSGAYSVTQGQSSLIRAELMARD